MAGVKWICSGEKFSGKKGKGDSVFECDCKLKRKIRHHKCVYVCVCSEGERKKKSNQASNKMSQRKIANNKRIGQIKS